MPRFDSIARAAVTPGGFQGGVNDIVAAILNADAKKAQAAAQGQEQALQEQRLAETIRANMAGEQGQMTRHSENLGLDKQRLGETLRHNMAVESRPGYQANEGLVEKRGFDLDLAQANLDTFGNPEGEAWIDQTSYDPLDIGREHPLIKKVKGPPAADVVGRRDQRLKELRALRAGGGQTVPAPSGRIVDQVVPKAGTAPVSPAAPATPVPGGPAANARQPLDYEALDAKYMSESPTYRQKRADPSFNWKAFLDARAPR